jgi:hypothetical protein
MFGYLERFAVVSDVFSGGARLVPLELGAKVELGLGTTNDPEKMFNLSSCLGVSLGPRVWLLKPKLCSGTG